MDLKQINLKLKYRSNDSDILSEFYVPCLSNCNMYQRAVGYFTSWGLTLAARGLSKFCKRNGRMQLIASPYLSNEDIDAINNGYSNIDDIVLKSLLNVFENISDETVINRLTLLSALVSSGRLEIKLALRTKSNKYVSGLYHEKIGIFTDEHANKIAFIGSANETSGGLIDNFESVQVFKSWFDPESRVIGIANDFEELWSNNTPGVSIIPFPDAANKKLLKVTENKLNQIVDFDELDLDITCSPVISPAFIPRDYQNEAVTAWIQNNYHGLFKMATGTGKTKTALHAVNILSETVAKLLVVIVVPFQHLVDQWAEECESFGYSTNKCCSSYPNWKEQLNSLRLAYLGNTKQIKFSITTYETFSGEAYQDIIGRFTCPKLLIPDEVHQMGAETYRINIEGFKYTLGLSATPERIYDPDGTQWIFDNIGPIVFEFNLSEAINKGYLCRYNYHIHIVHFTDLEMSDYYEIMELMTKAYLRGGAFNEESAGKNKSMGPLLRRRQELIGSASAKLPTLRSEISKILDTDGSSALNHTLVYSSSENFNDIMRLLSVELGLKLTKFTFEENISERRKILADFSNKRIKIILAKKCLDMGVDIPATKNAFILASSSNPMEFIQRRGRVLRPFPGKSHAEIHDFFVLPPPNYTISKYDSMLVERELKRAIEFSETAINFSTCHTILSEIIDRYNLHHL